MVNTKYEHLADLASRKALEPYIDGRKWYLCEESLDIGLAAEVIIDGRQLGYEWFIKSGQLKIFENFRQIEGDSFMCIYLKEAYILKRYKRQT